MLSNGRNGRYQIGKLEKLAITLSLRGTRCKATCTLSVAGLGPVPILVIYRLPISPSYRMRE